MWAARRWGDSEVALRLPSALAGVICVPITYGVATRWLGRKVGLLSALLVAVSPIHIWYSQEARPYALLMLLGLVAVRLLQRALDSPESVGATVGFAVCTAATFYVHTVAVAFIGALGLFVLLATPRRHLRSWLLTLAGIGLLCVPGGMLLARVPTVSANPAYRFDPSHLAYTLWTFGTGFSLGPTLTELRLEGLASVRRNVALVAPVLGLLSALLVWSVVSLWRDRRETLAALALWVTAPVAFVIVGAMVTSHPYNVRYTVLAIPPTLILLAVGIHALPHPRVRQATGALLLACSGAALWNYYTNPRYARDDNRGAAAFLRARAGPDDLVIASAGYTSQPLRHYLGDASLRVVGYPTSGDRAADVPSPTGRVMIDDSRVGEDLTRIIGDRAGFWLFLSRTFHSDPEGYLEGHADAHFLRLEEYHGPGVQVIRYGRPDVAGLHAP
jgi:4-amino-4-deoxy-L-arabinose transferase-like glycosyltransferase